MVLVTATLVFFFLNYYSKAIEGYCTVLIKWFNNFLPFYLICVTKTVVAITNITKDAL